MGVALFSLIPAKEDKGHAVYPFRTYCTSVTKQNTLVIKANGHIDACHCYHYMIMSQ